jgi:hypothetical protein
VANRSSKAARRTVRIDVDGTQHVGTYTTTSGVVAVTDDRGRSRTTQIGGSSAEHIARLLLHELVAEREAADKRL